MFNIKKLVWWNLQPGGQISGTSAIPADARCPSDDRLLEQVERVGYRAAALLERHVQANGLHKMSKEAVRNAMTYAHALEMSCAAYERELREQALQKSLAETAFTPEPALSAEED